MNRVQFVKMHGLKNDFVIIDARKQPIVLRAEQIQKIADRKEGVGCDQLVVIEASADAADAFVRFYNADGSESSTCGNATRCVAYLVGKSLNKAKVLLQTSAAVMQCECRDDGLVSVQMGVAKTHWQEIPLSQEVNTQSLPISYAQYSNPVAVSVGNPHAVFFVDDVDQVLLEDVGATVEVDDLFPERTNVEFAQLIDNAHIKLRVWERGSGVTQACGSGACAAVVAASLLYDMASSVAVDLPGGRLWIEVDGQLSVTMTGPVAEVFAGELQL